MAVKKKNCFVCSNFSHLLCFLLYNYLQYFLSSFVTLNNKQKEKLNVNGTVEMFTVQAPSGRVWFTLMLWWPFSISNVWNVYLLCWHSACFSKYLHMILAFYWMYLESIMRIFLYIILLTFLYWALVLYI